MASGHLPPVEPVALGGGRRVGASPLWCPCALIASIHDSQLPVRCRFLIDRGLFSAPLALARQHLEVTLQGTVALHCHLLFHCLVIRLLDERSLQKVCWQRVDGARYSRSTRINGVAPLAHFQVHIHY